MKTAFWDSGLRFDDPNLRWGDPSYLLEPGDPGYVADPTSASFPASKPKKRNTMPKSDFVKTRDAEFSNQLTLFKNNIGTYATALNVSAGQIAAQAADAAYFAFVLATQEVCVNCAEQWTGWKDLMRDGGDPGAEPGPAGFPPAVPAVAPGIEARFRELVRYCKSQPAYTPSVGEILGIEGAEQTGPDFATFKPLLTLKLDGGQVIVGWGWQGQVKFLDMIEIHVNRGNGYVMLTYDTTPNYTDTTPLPTPGQKWTYKAIYRVGDQRVGQWSDEASISVAA
jgi:hypothetical protein